jgi:uridine kinase
MITVILITGASGSGKSTLANRLRIEMKRSSCPGKRVISMLIHQDDYFAMPFKPYNERNDLSYEGHQGIDWHQMKAHIQSFINDNGNKLDCQNKEENIAGCDDERIIIVEGHMLGAAADMFHNIETYNGSHVKLFTVLIDCPRDVCRRRRLRRRSRSNSELDDLTNYFDNYVWPGYIKLGVPAMLSFRRMNEKVTRKRKCDNYIGYDNYIIDSSFIVEVSTANEDGLENIVNHVQNQVTRYCQPFIIRVEES